VRRAIVVLALVTAAPARANPIDAFGFGSRAAALGGAYTAIADDSSASYYNPAGLVRGDDLRVDIGYRWAHPLLRLNGRDTGVDDTRGVVAGLVAPGAIGPFRYAVGVALALPDQRLTRVRSLPFAEPRFVYYDNRTQRLLLSTNLAIQIVPGLYVGGGLTYMSRTQGALGLRGSVAVSNPDDSALVSKIDVDLVAVRYPQVGLLWEATRWLALGVSYRHSFLLDLDQQFRIDGNIGNPGLPPVVQGGYFAAHTTSTDLFQPWQLTVGAAVRFGRLLITYDLAFHRWSEMPVAASHLDLGLDIKQFNNAVHLPPSRDYPAPGFHDIVVPRLGVEWRAVERERWSLDVRGGYVYEASPAPEQTGESNLVDNDKHTFSIGAGVAIARLGGVFLHPVTVDAHVALTWLPPRAHRKDDPLDPVGDYVSDGVVVQMGLMLGSRY
jgi:long-chain fatty acid transport protein